MVAELIEQYVAENARVALDQTEYQKKYDGLDSIDNTQMDITPFRNIINDTLS